MTPEPNQWAIPENGYVVAYVPSGILPTQENQLYAGAETLRGARTLERLLRVAGHHIAFISERPTGGHVALLGGER